MAIRTPLVIVNGQVQQLQSGDTLNINSETVNLTNDNSSASPIGTAVYSDGNDTFRSAQANAASTAKVIGLVAQSPNIAAGQAGAVKISGILAATTAQWDAVVTGESGGLTAGTTYYLDPATAGNLTSTAPTTVGQYVVEVGQAISTTELKIAIKSSVLL